MAGYVTFGAKTSCKLLTSGNNFLLRSSLLNFAFGNEIFQKSRANISRRNRHVSIYKYSKRAGQIFPVYKDIRAYSAKKSLPAKEKLQCSKATTSLVWSILVSLYLSTPFTFCVSGIWALMLSFWAVLQPFPLVLEVSRTLVTQKMDGGEKPS